MTKNERIIKDIHPINGVSENQLWEHCSAIVDTIPASRSLDSFGKQTAVNDAVMALKKKMDQGILDKFDYFIFRGYLFRTLTNNVLRQIQIKNSSRIIKEYEIERYEDDLDLSYEYILPSQDERFELIYKVLDDREKLYLKELLDKLPHETVYSIRERHGISPQFLALLRQRITNYQKRGKSSKRKPKQ